MKIANLTTGADPELLLRNRKTKKIVSAIPIVPEGKENPKSLGNGFGMQHDNVLLEFQVPPSKGKKEFIATLSEGLRRVTKVIGKNYELVAQASYIFPKKLLIHQDANVFGCHAEFDAWKMGQVQPPECKTGLRSCGGHIHLGRSDFENPSDPILIDPFSKARVIRLMDIFLGVPFVMLENNDKTNKERKKLYGRASFHRPTPFGCEYRVLTNYWMRSPQLVDLAYDLAMLAAQAEIENKAEKIVQSVSPDVIIATINKASSVMAKKLLNKLPIPPDLRKRILSLEKQKFPAAIEKAWNIK
jgi:hypothetical protein